MLTFNEFLILRVLEQHPGSSAYDVFKVLQGSQFGIPMQSAYRGMNSLFGLCAVEKLATRTHVNGVKIQPYELTDAGRQSLSEIRAFFGEAA